MTPTEEAADAIKALLVLIRTDAPQLSGKTMGYAEDVLARLYAPVPQPTPSLHDRARLIASEVTNSVGPSDSARPMDYVLAGMLATLQHAPQSPAPSAADEAQPLADAGTIFRWLVEEFGADGNSTGRYMLDQGELTITTNVHEARQFVRSCTAMFRADDMRVTHGGDWRHMRHGFMALESKSPSVADRPAVTDTAVMHMGLALARDHAVHLTPASVRKLLADALAAAPEGQG